MHDGVGHGDGAVSVASIDSQFVERLYARCASFYDWLCGPVLHNGRREAMRDLKLRSGDDVLEIGIGTGLTASLYPPDCAVTGIDVSVAMLRQAEKNLAERASGNIRLLTMDATHLSFPDESFDVVYAAYVISVVPDPLAVLREMRRVCRPGGHLVLLNHFLSESPILAKVERLLSPFATGRLGFRTDLDARRLLTNAGLTPVSIRKVNTPQLWTLLRCRRDT